MVDESRRCKAMLRVENRYSESAFRSRGSDVVKRVNVSSNSSGSLGWIRQSVIQDMKSSDQRTVPMIARRNSGCGQEELKKVMGREGYEPGSSIVVVFFPVGPGALTFCPIILISMTLYLSCDSIHAIIDGKSRCVASPL